MRSGARFAEPISSARSASPFRMAWIRWLGLGVHPDIDAVGVAVRLGGPGPFAETPVADEQEPSAGDELGDLVGPGGGDRLSGQVCAGGSGGTGQAGGSVGLNSRSGSG